MFVILIILFSDFSITSCHPNEILMNTKQFSFLHNLIFRNKWCNPILVSLGEGPLRFNQIRQQLPLCSSKILSETLAKMVENRSLIRVQYPSMPLKVTYEINPTFLPVLNSFNDYSAILSQHVFQNEEAFNIPGYVIEKREWNGF